MTVAGSRVRSLALYAAVFLSGAAALIYQVAWMRRLASVTSATTTAQAVVLAVVMAGLGMGAWLGGRKARSLRAPGAAYAGVEALAATLAILSIPMIGASEFIRSGAPLFGADLRTGLSLQLAALALLLAAPATALGASLPFVVEALERAEPARATGRAAARIAILYGANTLGAVLGCWAAGFVLVERFGLQRTTWVGAGLALSAAALAVVATRMLPTRRAGDAAESRARRVAGDALSRPVAIALVAGFVGLAAEVVWTRIVALLIPNTTYLFSQVLACVLLGIALGAWALSPALRWAHRQRDPEAALYRVVALASGIGAVLLCSVPAAITMLAHAPTLQDRLAAGDTVTGVLLLAMVLVPGAAAVAALLPACVALRRRSHGGAESFGVLYAVNAVGCVLGSVAAGFVLLPALGSAGASAALGLLLCAVCAGALRGSGGQNLTWVAAPAALCVALTLTGGFPRAVYETRLEPGERVLEFREGRDSDVMVTENVAGRRRIWINSVWVAGTGGGHRGLGHLPSLFVERPQRALGIALGTGQTFASAQRHGFERLDCVEIDDGVIELSKRWFSGVTDQLFERPEVHLHHDDGRAFLRATRERFDLIVLEPLQAWTVGTSNLYSVEFYREAAAALAAGGVVAQWVPFYGQGVDETRAIVRAALEVFPQASLWLDDRDGILILQKEPFVLRPGVLEARVAQRGIADDLERNALGEIESLLSLFVMGPRGLASWVEGVDLLFDDRPFLEFSAARQVGLDTYPEILASVAKGLEPAAAYLPRPSDHERVVAAAAERIRGALLRERLAPRVSLPERAQNLETAIAAVSSSLLRRRYRNLMLRWARDAQEAGRLEIAEQAYRRALRNAPELGEAAVNLALLLARQERVAEARQTLDRPFRAGPVADSAQRVLAWLDAENRPSAALREAR